MKKLFLFKNVPVESAKVSAGICVGLPSMTALSGLSQAFALRLAAYLDLPVGSLAPQGALMAIEGFHRHEGAKKAFKNKLEATSEAVPASWASFTAHFAFEIGGLTEDADAILAGKDLNIDAQEAMRGLTLAKGRFRAVGLPVDLARYSGETERQRAMAALPSFSLVVCDYGFLMAEMRLQGLNLAEGLVAATLRPDQRTAPYQEFFEDQLAEIIVEGAPCKLAPVHSGYVYLDDTSEQANWRTDAVGEHANTRPVSPVYSLVRLQTAASLRIRSISNDFMEGFWTQNAHPCGYLCQAN